MRQCAHPLAWLLAGLFVVSAFINTLPAFAQESTAQVTLYPLYTEDFPLVTAYMDVHDSQGNFVSGLKTEDVQILENNISLPLDRLEQISPGVQFVMAVAPGSSFDIRDANGVSRFDYLRQAIFSWQQGSQTNDDYSLVIPWGSEIAHASELTPILAALSSYQALEEQIFPDLQILSRALELAAQPAPRPGMERAVLLITAPQAAESAIGLQSLAARARELGIRIYIWTLAAPEYFEQPESAPVRAVAGQTGGRFFGYSGSEAVPPLEEILEPLRDIYQLSYTSQVTTSGSYQAAALVTLDGAPVSSNTQTFEVTILPPQPVFISPPSLIQRAVPDQQEAQPTGAAAIELLPAEQALEVMINFPDDFVRPLVRTSLYVDGAIVDENTAEPFDAFTWDLRGYLESGEHILQVEALDNLGMNGLSVEMPVQISVATPERNILAALLRNKLLVVGMAVTLAGAVLALVLILGGKIRPPHPAQARKQGMAGGKAATTRPRRNDPVSQPVSILQTQPTTDPRKTRSRSRDNSQPRPRKPNGKAFAYLTPLAEAGTHTLSDLVPLEAAQAVLGSDPSQATILLADASVGAVHAILHWEQGYFRLVDNGSVAGTWVNYMPVGPQGVRLAHGDLIYTGGVGFRFNLRDPGRQPKPVARPYSEPEL